MFSEKRRADEVTAVAHDLQLLMEEIMKKNAENAFAHIALCQVRAWANEVLSDEHTKVMDAFMRQFGVTAYLEKHLPSPAYALRQVLRDQKGELKTKAVILLPDLLKPTGTGKKNPLLSLSSEFEGPSEEKAFAGYKGIKLRQAQVRRVVSALLKGREVGEMPAIDPEEFACAFILHKRLSRALSTKKGPQGRYSIPKNHYDEKHLGLYEAVEQHYSQKRFNRAVFTHCIAYILDPSLPLKGRGGVAETLAPRLAPFTAPPTLYPNGIALPSVYEGRSGEYTR